MKRTVIAAILVFLLAGCASGGTPMNTPSTPASSGAAHGEVSEARWNAILADLDGRGVATDDVQLVSAEQVTWNDGSLGCPKPGQSYTQAIVAGMKVVVSAEGKQYDYRFGTSDNPKLCDRTLKARGIRLR